MLVVDSNDRKKKAFKSSAKANLTYNMHYTKLHLLYMSKFAISPAGFCLHPLAVKSAVDSHLWV